MRLRGGLFALALLAAPAAANQASWPIIVSVTYPAGLTAGAGVARVDVLIGADARAIDIAVWGLDGMRAGNDNIVRVTRDQATAGARIDFDAPFHPGPGRSSLVVSAKAAFAGAGVTVLSFPYGAENADQLAEHSACVRQDSAGVWIRLNECEKNAAVNLPVLTVAELKAAPPVGSRAVLTGYVAGLVPLPAMPKGRHVQTMLGPFGGVHRRRAWPRGVRSGAAAARHCGPVRFRSDDIPGGDRGAARDRGSRPRCDSLRWRDRYGSIGVTA